MSDLDKRGEYFIQFFRYPTVSLHFEHFNRSRERFISGWRFSLLTQYFYNRHLNEIYNGILCDHFTYDEIEKLKPLAIGMNKSIEETSEDWSKQKWLREPFIYIFAPFLYHRLGLDFIKKNKIPLATCKWKWYSYNIFTTTFCWTEHPMNIYKQMTINPYYNGTMKHTESIDPTLFRDFKNIINKEYFKRHLAIEYPNQITWLGKSKIGKAVSDSFFIMVDLKEQERQIEAFSKDDSFITMEELKEQERQLEALIKGESIQKDKKKK